MTSVSTEITVNRLPSGDSDDLRGHPIYVGGTRFTIDEINEWQWIHLVAPDGETIATCVDTDETYLEVDDLPAHANELSRTGQSPIGPDRYLIEGTPAWVHHEYGEPTLCTWLSHGWEHFDTCVRASRLIKEYLHDGIDEDTTAAMVALATGVGISFA